MSAIGSFLPMPKSQRVVSWTVHSSLHGPVDTPDSQRDLKGMWCFIRLTIC